MDKSLTVLQLLPALESGGVERGTLEVAHALVQRGHRSLVISSGGQLVQQLVSQGSAHFQWPIDRKSLWTLRLVRALRRFIIQHQVDLIHYRSRVPGWVAYLAWRGMPIDRRPRLVSTLHGLHSISWYSAVMAKGEVVIAVSETVKDYLIKNYLDNDRKITTIYRGVDPGEFPANYCPSSPWLEDWRRQYPVLKDAFIVALPGRLTRLKGHKDFIQVIKLLKERGVAVKGVVIGGEDQKRAGYAKEIYQSVEKDRLQEDILFLGYRSDMREIYSQCGVILSLSTKPESFGRYVWSGYTDPHSMHNLCSLCAV